ncbi:MAG TPA: hypothetical protein VGM25_04030 [Caulobacteraceae bacterium]|jgi:hypothetical protein
MAGSFGVRIGLAFLAAFAAASVSAQPYGYGQYGYPRQPQAQAQPYADPRAQGGYGGQPYNSQPYNPQPYNAQPSAPRAYCCVLQQGTPLAIQVAEAVSTREVKEGDVFPIRLAAPVIVDGQVVLPTGTPGEGHVVQASGAGLGGKGAKLVVSADHLDVGGGRVPLGGLQLTATGKDHSTAADLASLGGWISFPLGFVGFAVTGGEIEIPAGTNAGAKVSRTVDLKPLGVASGQDYAQVQAVFGQPQDSRGWVQVSPPPKGMAQVVFFRSKSIGGFGQWFNVREHGEALGKLTNGAYFAVILPPGVHNFSASSEPEFKDHLTLKIDADETYYVEGIMTHGVVIGVANLTPSDKVHFDAASGGLEASTPPTGARIAG